MESNSYLTLKAVEKTLQFEYQMGNVATYRNTNSPVPKTCGWCKVPGFMSAQIMNGRQSLQIAGKNIIAKNKEAICIPPHISYYHTVHVKGDRSALSRWSLVNFWIFGKVNLFSILEVPYLIKGKRAQQIGDINEELSALRDIPNPTFSHIVKERVLGSMFLSILVEISVFRPNALHLLNASDRLEPVLNYINQNLDRQMRRQELAKIAAISPSRFDIFFNNALGISPVKYVQNIRLERSRELLLGSNFTVDEIGQKMGFQNPFNFSSFFKKHEGTSPSFYRKKVRETFSFKSFPGR